MTGYKEIIVALIAVFGAVVTYLLQKNKELNLKLAEQKREAYTSFLRNFTETAVAVMHDEDVSGKDADRDRMFARDQLLLYGSDDVIKAYDTWVRYADTEEHDLDREGELVSLILLAIRKDLMGKSKVTKEHLSSLNPFNRG
jgi:DNA topoisomerase IA